MSKIAFKKCCCRLKCKKNCSCKKENVSCLLFVNTEERVTFYESKMIIIYAFVLFYELISVNIELNFISTYFIDCVNLNRSVQMCLLGSIEDRKKALTVPVNFVIYDPGIIIYIISNIFLVFMLVQG